MHVIEHCFLKIFVQPCCFYYFLLFAILLAEQKRAIVLENLLIQLVFPPFFWVNSWNDWFSFSFVFQAKQHLALLCLGEIGRRKDLSSHARIENIVIESFQSPFEEIKSAASYALGNIAVGNLSKYLPFILDQIDNQQKKQYLLLHSLKEVL